MAATQRKVNWLTLNGLPDGHQVLKKWALLLRRSIASDHPI
ncbi:MAG: hypothetical protein RTU63_03575 [Candidatus Thorarchaeota archaeon]